MEELMAQQELSEVMEVQKIQPERRSTVTRKTLRLLRAKMVNQSQMSVTIKCLLYQLHIHLCLQILKMSKENSHIKLNSSQTSK